MNHYHNDLLDIPIKDAAAHIFRRPYLFVDSSAPMLQIATYLAIGPQIYIDGLVVINNKTKKAIGRISSKHIITNILKTDYPHWLEITAEQIMDDFVGTIDMDLPLSKALEVFNKTRFAFVPIIAAKNKEAEASLIVASLSIRDILPLIAKTNSNRPIKDLCSPLISVNKNTDIRTAIDFMMKQDIRNIGVKESTGRNGNKNNNKLLRIINDRKILEFLLSHNGREIMRRDHIAGLADINVNDHLEMISATKVKSNTAVSNAAELLMEIGNPCLILEEEQEEENYSIVTPWDIVMKTLK